MQSQLGHQESNTESTGYKIVFQIRYHNSNTLSKEKKTSNEGRTCNYNWSGGKGNLIMAEILSQN